MIYPDLNERMLDHCSPEQIQAIDTIANARGGIAWWKVGEGKTRIGLFTFARLQNAYDWSLPSICLVVCRRRAFRDWRDEINRLFTEASVYEDEVPAHPPGDQPVFLLVSHAEVEKKLASLQANKLIRFVILDECWMYANNKSKRSKAVRLLTLTRKAIGLSGTVMKAQDTLEIYCQLMAVGKEKRLASSPTAFRTQYQKCFSVQLPTGRSFPSYTPKPGAYKKIMEIVSDCCHTYFPENPSRQIHEQFHNVPATPQQRKHFFDLKEYAALEDFDIEYDNALELLIRAQQIANGFVTTPEGDIIRIPTNKPAKLAEELEDILTAGSRAIVWCAFRQDIEILADALPFASLQMHGGQEFDLDAWNRGDARICLATEASGVSVNHFDQTPYAIYYSSTVKWLDMQQSRGRTDRKSSRHSKCYYKYLQVDGSMDSHIYRLALEAGASERKLITQGMKQWLKES